jgi:RNase H-like domain found in reverse transcriptase
LTSLTSSKVKFEWLPTHQQAFDKIKKVFETELLLTNPDFDKPFHIYTDASDHQLGAVIMQEKSLYPFIQESLIQPNKDTPPLNVSCYLLLKPAKNTRIYC